MIDIFSCNSCSPGSCLQDSGFGEVPKDSWGWVSKGSTSTSIQHRSAAPSSPRFCLPVHQSSYCLLHITVSQALHPCAH